MNKQDNIHGVGKALRVWNTPGQLCFVAPSEGETVVYVCVCDGVSEWMNECDIIRVD